MMLHATQCVCKESHSGQKIDSPGILIPDEYVCAACDLDSLQVRDAIPNHGNAFVGILVCSNYRN